MLLLFDISSVSPGPLAALVFRMGWDCWLFLLEYMENCYLSCCKYHSMICVVFVLVAPGWKNVFYVF